MEFEGESVNPEERQVQKQSVAGRKPKQASRSAEFRERLIAWQKTPVRLQPSLRALASELGTSHQLLKHYLDGMEKWKRDRDLERLRANAKAKGIVVTPMLEEKYLAWVRDCEEREAQERRKYRGLAKEIAAAREMLNKLYPHLTSETD
jgi:hypothetical protein